MAPEAIRTRASKPKTRSGCRTCKARHIKCDEGRPSCRRCVASNRICAGYADRPVNTKTQSEHALILPKPAQLLRAFPSNLCVKVSDVDAMHLDFFRLYTVKDLPGGDLGIPWPSLVHSTGSCNSVILRAATALSCLHRAQTDSQSAVTTSSVSNTAPYELYQNAIVALRQYIDRMPEHNLATAIETTLITVFLLYCFEVVSDNDYNASKHLMAAFALLPRHDNGPAGTGPKSQANLVLNYEWATSTDALNQLYLRLASDWIVSGPLYYGGDTSPLQAICRESMPESFQSHRDAAVHLDALCSEAGKHEMATYEAARRKLGLPPDEIDWCSHNGCVNNCLTLAQTRVPDVGEAASQIEEVKGIVMALARWRAAVSHLIDTQPQSQPLMLLEIRFLQIWIGLYTTNDYEQMLCDNLQKDFERVVSVAEEYLRQQAATLSEKGASDRRLRSLPLLGNNLTSCICLVIELCRDSRVRRRGLNILRAIDLRGVFDTSYVVAYYQHLVDEEELRARAWNPTAPVELRCRDIPRSARFLETCMCFCGPDVSGDEFYRKDIGRMVYTMRDGLSADLELGESVFTIERHQ